MKFFHILTEIFFIFTCSCFLPIHCRLYSNSISLSPSSATDALGPSYDGNGPPAYNIRSFGAVGDSVSDDTQAFKLAWDTACQAEESGTLLVPDGYIFMIQSTIFTGPCKTAITFQIEGTVVAPDGPDSWSSGSSKRQWLVFYRINGLSMQGAGVIDGRGEKWWDLPCKPHHHKGNKNHGPCDSPVAIRFFMSSNVTVQGVKVMNSPQFHFRFDGCQDVHVENLVIKSPALSPNTDGIHIEKTNNVQIYNSLVSNGDDCVSIGAGCYNVDIKNLTCGPSHGIRHVNLVRQNVNNSSKYIGSLGNHNSKACVSNIRVTESVIKHSDNGVRIKTWQGGAGAVSNVTFSNIFMDTVRNPIIIDQYYCLSKDCINQTSSVFVSNVSYSNIKGTYDVRSPPVRFACSDSVPCTNLTLSEVELLPAQGYFLADPFCWNAYGTMQTLTVPPVLCLLEGNPLTLPQLDVIGC